MKLPSGFTPALELEADQPTITALEIGIGPPALLALPQTRMDDPRDLWCFLRNFDHGLGVAAVLADAQGQGLEPLEEQERVERDHGRAEIAQQRHPRLDDVGDGPQRLHRLWVQTAP